jgi:hypothetical protein
MTKRWLVLVSALLVSLVVPERAFAQNQPPPPATPAPPRATVGTAPGAAPRNIRFDIVITDTGVTMPISKTVTVNVSAGGNGSIRSNAKLPGGRVLPPRTVTSQGPDGKPQTTTTPSPEPSISLNVDVTNPVIYEDNGIRAMVVIEYQPYVPPSTTRPEPAVVRANALTVFNSGTKMVLLQAADPMTDRRKTIEVTATIVR